jgi:probable addiction module antidote protein
MTTYRTLDEITEEHLRQDPDGIDDFVTALFDEYAETGDEAALLSSLRLVSRVKGVTQIADATGLSRKGVQKALSENGNPQFNSMNAILQAMGYRLMPQKLPQQQQPAPQ